MFRCLQIAGVVAPLMALSGCHGGGRAFERSEEREPLAIIAGCPSRDGFPLLFSLYADGRITRADLVWPPAPGWTHGVRRYISGRFAESDDFAMVLLALIGATADEHPDVVLGDCYGFVDVSVTSGRQRRAVREIDLDSAPLRSLIQFVLSAPLVETLTSEGERFVPDKWVRP